MKSSQTYPNFCSLHKCASGSVVSDIFYQIWRLESSIITDKMRCSDRNGGVFPVVGKAVVEYGGLHFVESGTDSNV